MILDEKLMFWIVNDNKKQFYYYNEKDEVIELEKIKLKKVEINIHNMINIKYH